MLHSVHRFARLAALCGALVVFPSLAGAGEWSRDQGSESSFGGGAVFVGRGGQVDRGVTFGFGEGRGVAVVGGSFDRYERGSRMGARIDDAARYLDRSGYANDARRRGGAAIGDRRRQGGDIRDINRARLEDRRDAFHERRRFESDGSFVRLRDSGRIDRFGRDPRYETRRPEARRGFQGSRTLTVFDAGDWGGGRGVVSYGAPYPAYVDQGPPIVSGSVGPKILNVETERLDRRSIGPSGLDVVMTGGGAKIIRIAPGYRTAKAETPRPAASRNTDGLGLQPWSTGWLRYCTRAHASFDPDLGTYVTEGGRVRFCTAE